MKLTTTMFLRLAIGLFGLTVFALCLWLPWLAHDTAEAYPKLAYLQIPILALMYAAAVPFFVGEYQALKLLSFIDSNTAFSEGSVTALKSIKYCALAIAVIYGVSAPILFLVIRGFQPQTAIIAFLVIFASAVIAVLSGVLQKLLRDAIDIKSENDLTV